MSQYIPIPRAQPAPAAAARPHAHGHPHAVQHALAQCPPPHAPASLPAPLALGAVAAAAATANSSANPRNPLTVSPGQPATSAIPIAAPGVPNHASSGCPSISADHCLDDPHVGGDDQHLSTSWPPRPSLELVTRSARLWAAGTPRATGTRASSMFQPDFSEVASAVNSFRDALRTGRAGVERPPRESVSGTYFFRRVESGGVMSAVDEQPAQSAPSHQSGYVQRFATTRRDHNPVGHAGSSKSNSARPETSPDSHLGIPKDQVRHGEIPACTNAPPSDEFVRRPVFRGSRFRPTGARSSNAGADAADTHRGSHGEPGGPNTSPPRLDLSLHVGSGEVRLSDKNDSEKFEGNGLGAFDFKSRSGRPPLPFEPPKEDDCTEKRTASLEALRRFANDKINSHGDRERRPPTLSDLSLGESSAERNASRYTESMSSQVGYTRSKSALESLGGGSGSSFIPIYKSSAKKRVTAVFKPADEEPSEMSPPDSLLSSPSPVHPRGSPDFLEGNGSRAARMAAAGFHPGEGAFKEVAAYVLDHENFAKVPQTALARCTIVADSDSASNLKTKMGAFQVYVENVGDADDWGPGKFPKEDIHRIAILDIRTLNYDRHGGNILVTKDDNGSFGLVPIDHAFTLPEVVQAVPWPVWMDWPAAKKPLSAETLAYIAGLEPDLESRLLHDELCGALRPRSYRSLKLATRLLQKGAAAGLSLYDIGTLIFAREGETEPEKSDFEKIVDEAIDSSIYRQSHLGESLFAEALDSPPTELLFPLDGPVPPPSPPPPVSVVHTHNEDYIMKYAGRLMDNLISRIVASKDSGRRPVHRARSIPDFAFGLGTSTTGASTGGVRAPPPSPFGAPRRSNFKLRWASSPPRDASGAPAVSSPLPLLESLGESVSSTGRQDSTKFSRSDSTPARLVAPVPVTAVGSSMLEHPALLGRAPSMGKSSPVSPHDF